MREMASRLLRLHPGAIVVSSPMQDNTSPLPFELRIIVPVQCSQAGLEQHLGRG